MLSRINIVVESILDGGTDAELHARIQLLESLSEKVGR